MHVVIEVDMYRGGRHDVHTPCSQIQRVFVQVVRVWIFWGALAHAECFE